MAELQILHNKAGLSTALSFLSSQLITFYASVTLLVFIAIVLSCTRSKHNIRKSFAPSGRGGGGGLGVQLPP